jgi:hypothetical protein
VVRLLLGLCATHSEKEGLNARWASGGDRQVALGLVGRWRSPIAATQRMPDRIASTGNPGASKSAAMPTPLRFAARLGSCFIARNSPVTRGVGVAVKECIQIRQRTTTGACIRSRRPSGRRRGGALGAAARADHKRDDDYEGNGATHAGGIGMARGRFKRFRSSTARTSIGAVAERGAYAQRSTPRYDATTSASFSSQCRRRATNETSQPSIQAELHLGRAATAPIPNNRGLDERVARHVS